MNLNAFAERAAYSMFELQMIREFGETISKEQIADVHEMIDCFKLPEWVTETLEELSVQEEDSLSRKKELEAKSNDILELQFKKSDMCMEWWWAST